jgi:N-acetylmuramoyl-L-alanine amidase
MAERFTIVLDAGHGGTALAGGSTPNNAVGAGGLLEKDLTLTVAKLAAARLAANGFHALLTRTEDRNLPLAERARKSREAGADAFVSIHFNGHRNEAVDGTEVFISNAADENDSALAGELLKNISEVASAPPRGVRKTDFTILKGDYHVAKTAACLVEMAYLTNPAQARKLLLPGYLEELAGALARSVAAYARRSSPAQSLADEGAEKLIAEASKEHRDAKNFPIDMPEPGRGTDTFRIAIPKGLRFSRWEIEVTALSAGAGYQVTDAPKAGAEGNSKISVEWSHLPYGKIDYKLKAYASPDGKSAAREKIVFDAPGWMEKAKDQIRQGLPLSLAVKGEKAKQIYEALQKHQANLPAKQAGGISIAMEPVTITVVVLVGIVIFGILVALGLLTLGAIIKLALDKGYDVKDTKYKAGVGEGELRQDHEIAFNITRPEKTTRAQSLSFGLADELDAGYFQPLDDDGDYRFEPLDATCGNAGGIKRGEDYFEFAAMGIASERANAKQNVFLRWCDVPKNKCEIDVVVHFHGHDIREQKDKLFFEHLVKISGLELLKPDGTLTRGSRPTLCIVPLGGKYTRDDGHYGYHHRFFNSDDGLLQLINFAFKALAARHSLAAGDFRVGRLILTGHSGGGGPLALILNRRNKGTLKLPNAKDVDEVHLFDAIYGCLDKDGKGDDGCQYRPIHEWAKTKIAADTAAKLSEVDMRIKGGALRVIYESTWRSPNTLPESGKLSAVLNKFYRVEKTACDHNIIPKEFGPALLENAGANLAVEKCDKPKPKPKPASSAKGFGLYDEDEPDYFAARETNFYE